MSTCLISLPKRNYLSRKALDEWTIMLSKPSNLPQTRCVTSKRRFKPLFTARKRSLGQGNIFIDVCQEFCSRGGFCSWGVSAPGGWGCLLPGGSALGGGGCYWGCLLLGGYLVETPLTDTAAGSMHPTGTHSCLLQN